LFTLAISQSLWSPYNVNGQQENFTDSTGYSLFMLAVDPLQIPDEAAEDPYTAYLRIHCLTSYHRIR